MSLLGNTDLGTILDVVVVFILGTPLEMFLVEGRELKFDTILVDAVFVGGGGGKLLGGGGGAFVGLVIVVGGGGGGS